LIAQELGGSGRTIELVFPMAFASGSYAVNMPAASGTLMLVGQLQTPAGQVPFNAGASAGLPTGALAVSSAPLAGALMRFDTNGNCTVLDPTADGQPANKRWTDLNFLSKTDTTVLKSTSVIQANGVASALNFYSAQAVNQKLADYVTATELADIIANLQNGETGASALAITQLTMSTLNSTYDLIADTFNVVTVTQSGTLRLPADPPANSVVGIGLVGITAGAVVTVNMQSPFLGTATTSFTTRVPNEYFYFQINANGFWTRINHGEFFLATKNNSSTLSRFRGNTATLPTAADYELGSVLKLSANVTVGDKIWRNGALITRVDSGWAYSQNDDTTDLEELYNTLITGFTNLNAAL